MGQASSPLVPACTKKPQKIAAFGSSYRERFGNAVG
jgi:hypothetical protein